VKIQRFRRKDGHLQIRRLLEHEEVLRFSLDDPLTCESSIIWLEDIKPLPFVRVLIVPNCENRNGPLEVTGAGRVIGYSTLFSAVPRDTKTGKFTRRVFYLKTSDIDVPPSAQPNLNGVMDPKSIKPGMEGVAVTSIDESLAAQRASGEFVLPMRGASIVADWLGEEEIASLMGDEDNDDFDGNEDAGSEVGTGTDDAAGLGELVPIEGGPTIPLPSTDLLVGRRDVCDIVLPSRSVSGQHCRLTFEDGCWFVRDLNSTNGVEVDGTRIDATVPCRLAPGAVLRLANLAYELRYRAVDARE
jgi:hypothetical protein